MRYDKTKDECYKLPQNNTQSLDAVAKGLMVAIILQSEKTKDKDRDSLKVVRRRQSENDSFFTKDSNNMMEFQ